MAGWLRKLRTWMAWLNPWRWPARWAAAKQARQRRNAWLALLMPALQRAYPTVVGNCRPAELQTLREDWLAMLPNIAPNYPLNWAAQSAVECLRCWGQRCDWSGAATRLSGALGGDGKQRRGLKTSLQKTASGEIPGPFGVG